ncbi:hypothetical protein V8E55_001249 [Tylopilus felleus]
MRYHRDYERELQSAHEIIEQLATEIKKLKKRCGSNRPMPMHGPPGASDQGSQTLFEYKPLYLVDTPTTPNFGTAFPTKATHPGIRFWTYKKRGKEPYLEEEDGSAVDHSRLTIICRTVQSGFSELHNMKCAPQVWGDLNATGGQFFHSYMESNFPLFRCAIAGWKLDNLAHSMYPSWKKGCTDQNRNWVDKVIKRTRSAKSKGSSNLKEKPKVSFSLATSGTQVPDSMNLQSDEFLYVSPPHSQSCSSIPIDPVLLALDTVMSSGDHVHSSTLASSTSSTSLTSANLDLSTNVVVQDLERTTSSTGTDTIKSNTIMPSESSMSTNVIVQDLECTASSTGTDTIKSNTIMPSESLTSTNATSAKLNNARLPARLQYHNPLKDLAQTAATLGIKMLTLKKPATSTQQPTSGAVNLQPEPPLESTTACGQKGKKSTKLRVGTAKNGRNLCGHRWKEAFKHTSQYRDNFNAYYDALAQEQKNAYAKEAVDLADKDWKTDPAIQSGTLY